jgi:hypothetical protein
MRTHKVPAPTGTLTQASHYALGKPGNSRPGCRWKTRRKTDEKQKKPFQLRSLALCDITGQVMKDSKTPSTRGLPGSKPGGLSADIQSRIGHQLRAIYDEVVRQGVPPRFAELLEQLGNVESQSATVAADDHAAKDNGRV